MESLNNVLANTNDVQGSIGEFSAARESEEPKDEEFQHKLLDFFMKTLDNAESPKSMRAISNSFIREVENIEQASNHHKEFVYKGVLKIRKDFAGLCAEDEMLEKFYAAFPNATAWTEQDREDLLQFLAQNSTQGVRITQLTKEFKIASNSPHKLTLIQRKITLLRDEIEDDEDFEGISEEEREKIISIGMNNKAVPRNQMAEKTKKAMYEFIEEVSKNMNWTKSAKFQKSGEFIKMFLEKYQVADENLPLRFENIKEHLYKGITHCLNIENVEALPEAGLDIVRDQIQEYVTMMFHTGTKISSTLRARLEQHGSIVVLDGRDRIAYYRAHDGVLTLGQAVQLPQRKRKRAPLVVKDDDGSGVSEPLRKRATTRSPVASTVQILIPAPVEPVHDLALDQQMIAQDPAQSHEAPLQAATELVQAPALNQNIQDLVQNLAQAPAESVQALVEHHQVSVVGPSSPEQSPSQQNGQDSDQAQQALLPALTTQVPVQSASDSIQTLVKQNQTSAVTPSSLEQSPSQQNGQDPVEQASSQLEQAQVARVARRSARRRARQAQTEQEEAREATLIPKEEIKEEVEDEVVVKQEVPDDYEYPVGGQQ